MTKKELEENMSLLLNYFVQENKVNITDIEILEPISDRGFKVNVQTETTHDHTLHDLH